MRERRSHASTSRTYGALLEALSQSGCPVCRLVDAASRRYLDTLFYEHGTDVGTRLKLRWAWGFCNWHAWQATQMATSALGIALITKEILTAEIARLRPLLRSPRISLHQRRAGEQVPRGALRRFLQARRQRAPCPVCAVAVTHEQYALETLLDALDDLAFVPRFTASAGLCVRHLHCVAERHGCHPRLHTLFEIQCGTYRRVVRELEEFCRKNDYRFTHEPWGAEADVWLRAIALLAGQEGVFGNDRDRQRSEAASPRWGRRLLARGLRWMLGGTRPLQRDKFPPAVHTSRQPHVHARGEEHKE